MFYYSIGLIALRDNVTQFISNVTLTLSEEKSNSVENNIVHQRISFQWFAKRQPFLDFISKIAPFSSYNISVPRKTFWNSLVWNQKAREAQRVRRTSYFDLCIKKLIQYFSSIRIKRKRGTFVNIHQILLT